MFRCSFLLLFALSLPVSLLALAEQQRGKRKEQLKELRWEEQEDYYNRWLNVDVVYIISPEEREVFDRLSTPEEKEQFIEQFWYRRDPDPLTVANEFKEEHYRRIVYANESFSSGFPGWKTDRGRIYIIHGPPDSMESYPSGGLYVRPFDEGGGTTATFPFEKWWYRHIPGVGSGIELQFVDPSMTGEYRLALWPEEKDALLHSSGSHGLTQEEMLYGVKRGRAYFHRDPKYPWMGTQAKDNPFLRYETYDMVQRSPEITFKDLKGIVQVNITYSDLPFRIRQDYFKLNENQVLVPVTLEFENKALTFKEENGVYNAKLAIYGIVTSITKRVITEFQHDLITSYRPKSLSQGLAGRSMYQKIVLLDKKIRYKLELVAKDLNSGHVGVTRTAIAPPPYKEEIPTASSLLLSDFMSELSVIPRSDEMFVIGDVKVRPSISKVFPASGSLGVYFQLYHVGIDQTSLSPSLSVNYQVVNREGRTVLEMVEESGESIQFFSHQRVVIVKALPTEKLEPGAYQLRIKVQDRIKDQAVSVKDDFELFSAPTNDSKWVTGEVR